MPNMEDIPLDRYHIVQDQDRTMTDYLMAIYELHQKMTSLRIIQIRYWHEVVYDGLNFAVAGAPCNRPCRGPAHFFDHVC